MIKRFLLTAGGYYYPEAGDGNWIKMADTMEEVELMVEILEDDYYGYRINGEGHHWYKIIDLEEWSNK